MNSISWPFFCHNCFIARAKKLRISINGSQTLNEQLTWTNHVFDFISKLFFNTFLITFAVLKFDSFCYQDVIGSLRWKSTLNSIIFKRNRSQKILSFLVFFTSYLCNTHWNRPIELFSPLFTYRHKEDWIARF